MTGLRPKEETQAPADSIEVVLTLSPELYKEFAPELDQLRERLDAPSNTQAVLEAVRRMNKLAATGGLS